MSNIFKENLEESSIFKDETVFFPDYFPESICSRDKEIKEMIYNLKPLITQKKANNILIHGPPGTGKTLTSKYVLEQLKEYTTKVNYKYINCIKDNSRYSILLEISNFLGAILPRRGLAIDEILEKIQEFFKKSNIHPIIILDEIDKLSIDDASKILYDLSRFSINNKYFSLILITNYKNFIIDLDNRTQSSLFLDEIKFNKYTPIDIKQILKERIDFGLLDGVIDDDLIGYIAGFSAKRGGDARVGIDLLYKASKEADKQGFNKINKDCLFLASKLVDSIKLSQKVNYLSNPQKEILEKLEDGMLLSKLYKKTDIPQRTVRRYLSDFVKLDLINLEDIRIKKTNTKKIILNFSKELIL